MSLSPHILLVEDDREISTLVARFLRSNDCRVSLAGDGKEMTARLADARIDLILLDVMLPGEDGLSLFRRLRTSWAIPVIMLTAKREEIDRVVGLELGADDYVTKPFSPRELLARIRAVLRRSVNAEEHPARTRIVRASFAGWSLDMARRTLTAPSGARVAVTDAEWDLLRALCERSGRILSRDKLMDLTQGRPAGPFERSIDILVSRLRRKIEQDPQNPEIIKTVRSGGYLFAAPVELVEAEP